MMKKIYLILISLIVLSSCSNDDDTTDTNQIEGTFIHQIPNCDITTNPEINCSEFVTFKNDNEVGISIGGSDIIFQTTYQISQDIITIIPTQELNFVVSFRIIDPSTLERVENDEIWLKRN